MTAVPPLGFTATLTVGDGSASAQQAFKFPITIDVPSGTVGKVDVSYLGMSTRDRLFVSGLFDNGECAFEMLYDKADYLRLVALKAVTKTWVITFPDDTTGSPPTFAIFGFLTKFPMKFEMENVPHIACAIQISGPIVIA